MTLFAALLIFILGTAIGSFLSVAIYRLHHHEKGIIFSRSICPACKKKLKWRHLIPIFSWIFLGGRCAYCGKKISVHYFLLEIVTGLTFLTVFLNWNFLEGAGSLINPEFISYSINWQTFEIFLFYLLIFTFLIAIFFHDLLYKEIPDHFSLPAVGVAIAGGLIFGTPVAFDMILGLILISGFFLLQFLISKGKWIGGGDIRLGALIGILLGWEQGLMVLVLAYFVGAIVSILLLMSGKAHRKTAIALGPFLIIATTVAIFWGQQMMDWYFNTLTI